MNKSLVVLKLGGACLRDPEAFHKAIETVRGFRQHDFRVVLVHGGGPAINAALNSRGLQFEFIRGLRKTTPEMMDIIEETLVGEVNVSLVEGFNEARIPAVGFSGAENGTLFCEPAAADLGLVGDIRSVNTLWIDRLLAANGSVVPVIAPIGIGAGGEKYNINADWAAAKIAGALHADQLIFLTDQDGVLDEAMTLIPNVDVIQLKGLTDRGVVTGGMLTKVSSVVDALRNGVGRVRIMAGREAVRGLWSDQIGTMCVRGEAC